MHKHLCWIGRGTHIRGTQHDNKLQHGHTQQDINGTVITCVHTCHLWDSHVFTLFVCGMQRIHKHKKVGCALTESLLPTEDAFIQSSKTGRGSVLLSRIMRGTCGKDLAHLLSLCHRIVPCCSGHKR